MANPDKLKKRKVSTLRFFMITHLFFTLFLTLTSCSENDISEVKSLSTDGEDIPLIVMDNAEIRFTDSAITKANINSTRVENYFYYNSEQELDSQILKMSHGIKAKFYNEKGELNSTLTAEKATRNEKTKLTEIENNVVVINTEGDSLTTEYLIWDENKNTISSDKHVRVRTSNEIIFAEGFDSDVNFTNYTFRKFKGSISLE